MIVYLILDEIKLDNPYYCLISSLNINYFDIYNIQMIKIDIKKFKYDYAEKYQLFIDNKDVYFTLKDLPNIL